MKRTIHSRGSGLKKMKKNRIEITKNKFKVSLSFVSFQIPICPSRANSRTTLKRTSTIKPAKDTKTLKNILPSPKLIIIKKTHTYNTASPIKKNEFDLVSSFKQITLSNRQIFQLIIFLQNKVDY